jgi:hypothetical protein
MPPLRRNRELLSFFTAAPIAMVAVVSLWIAVGSGALDPVHAGGADEGPSAAGLRTVCADAAQRNGTAAAGLTSGSIRSEMIYLLMQQTQNERARIIPTFKTGLRRV